MISFLNKKYAALGEVKFFRFAPILCYICDILVFYYIIVDQIPRGLNAKTIKFAISLRSPGVAQNMSMSDFNEIALLMQNQIAFVMSLFLVFHAVIYTMASFRKKWPMKYISNYTFFGAILTVVEVILVLFNEGAISTYTFISLIGYSFIYLGYRYFRKKAEQ